MPRKASLQANHPDVAVGHDDDVGILVELSAPDSGPELYIITADSPKTDSEFIYGLFPTKLMVLLIAAKNKFRPLTEIDHLDTKTLDVSLKGIILPAGTSGDYSGLLTYSTLPFVYICENNLGKNGLTIPMLECGEHADTFKESASITLNRDCGNFYLINPATKPKDIDLSPKVQKINGKDFKQLLDKYNGDFLDSGASGGSLPDQINNSLSVSRSYLTKNTLFADIMQEIADRWFNESSNIADYNIGAGIYLEKFDQTKASAGDSVTYSPVATSLNIKSVNKAAHAEVRIAILLDFLMAYSKASPAAINSTPLQKWSSPLISAQVKLERALQANTKIGLYSSLLPCYMCLGNIESTLGGYIKTINGQDVGMDATFNGVAQTALIVDTEYYDVDSTLEYRNIDIYTTNTTGAPNLVASVEPINVSEPLSSNVRLSLRSNPEITADPLSIANAGSKELGVGLQNNESMWRYTLAAASLKLIHGKHPKLIVDQDHDEHEHTGHAASGPVDVHSYGQHV